MTNAPAHKATTSSRVSRRSILRTSAHALWAVPAIQVVNLASSMATSGSPTLDLTVVRLSKVSLAGTGSVTYKVTTGISGGTVTGLQVTFTDNGPGVDQKVLRPGAVTVAATRGTLVSSPGWTLNPGQGQGPYVATYLGNSGDAGEVGSGDARTFTVRFDNCNTNPDFRLKIAALASPSGDGTLTGDSVVVRPFNAAG